MISGSEFFQWVSSGEADDFHPACVSRLDPDEGVFEDQALCWRAADEACSFEKNFGVRLTPADIFGADDGREEPFQTGHFDHGVDIFPGRRRSDSAGDTGIFSGEQKIFYPWQRTDAFAAKDLAIEFFFAIAASADFCLGQVGEPPRDDLLIAHSEGGFEKIWRHGGPEFIGE